MMDQRRAPMPAKFRQNMLDIKGQAAGEAWLERIPGLVDFAATRWQLIFDAPHDNLSYNYVETGVAADGTRVMLKICGLSDEFWTELTALQAFQGPACVRLIDADTEHGLILMERLQPGMPLGFADADAAARVFARVMRALPRDVPAGAVLPDVRDWAGSFKHLYERYEGGTGPLPADLVRTAEAIFAERTRYAGEASSDKAEGGRRVLLHGDLHHDNILRHGDTWLAIDPKGVTGEIEIEPIAFLNNHLQDYDGADAVLDRQVDIICAEAGLDRYRLLQYGVAHCTLKACWSVEDHGADYEPAITSARAFERLLG